MPTILITLIAAITGCFVKTAQWLFKIARYEHISKNESRPRVLNISSMKEISKAFHKCALKMIP